MCIRDRDHRVPIFMDAADGIPPMSKFQLFAKMGCDLYTVSGGKGLCGPQSSGVLLGRKDLIEAALANSSPWEGAVCRPMKVGKEEIMGCLAAVEAWYHMDVEKLSREWAGRVQRIATLVGTVPGVEMCIRDRVNTVNGQKQEILSLGDPDGNTYDREHRLLDCASVLRAIIRLSPDGKSYTTVVDRYQGKRLNSPNDVVLGPDGAIYFTDPTSDLPKDQKQEIPFKGVYRIATDGQLQLLTKDLEDPNGLAFSPDGTKFYVDDSTQRNIRVYDFSAGRLRCV